MPEPFKGIPKTPPRPPKAPEPPKEKPKADFFGPKNSFTRSELIGRLRNAPREIPDSSQWLSEKERVDIEKKFDYRTFGPDISRNDARTLIRNLQREKNSPKKTYQERRKIDHTISWMKKYMTGEL